MALVFALSHVLTLVSSSPSPEELPSSSALRLTFGEDSNSFYEDIPDSFTSAYLNVSRRDDFGWKWERTEVG